MTSCLCLAHAPCQPVLRVLGLHVVSLGDLSETQGWWLRRCLSFIKNRLANRPNRPRDPILRKLLLELGFEWPEPESEEEGGEEEEEAVPEEAEEEGEEEAEAVDEPVEVQEQPEKPAELGEVEVKAKPGLADRDLPSSGTPKPNLLQAVSTTQPVATPSPKAQPSPPAVLRTPVPAVTPAPRAPAPLPLTPEAVTVPCKHSCVERVIWNVAEAMKTKLKLLEELQRELERVRRLKLEKVALEEPKCEYPIPAKPAGMRHVGHLSLLSMPAVDPSTLDTLPMPGDLEEVGFVALASCLRAGCAVAS